MRLPHMRIAVVVAMLVVYVSARLLGAHVAGLLAAYLLLMVAPGFALHGLACRNGNRLEISLAAFAASPVLTAGCGAALLVAGLSPASTTTSLVFLWSGVAAVAAWRMGRTVATLSRRETVTLVGFIVLLCVLTGYLPMTDQWWRIRSDAWFHYAVVAQINDFGVPPQDPYFLGIPLQYMWFYHVLVSVLSHATGVGPFWVMAVINVQALVGLVLATFLFASVLKERFSHRFASTAMVLLGFNGLYWLLLPVKLGKAFLGDVRGFDEVARQLSLSPFTYDKATAFMQIYFNQEFFLDKFMVATAFGLGLCLLAASWYAAVDFLRTGRGVAAALLFVSLVGMLGFHSLVGFVTLVGIFGAAGLMFLTRDRVDGFSLARTVSLLAVSLAAFIVMTPYLYAVMHLKESEQVIPFSLSFDKTAAIAISSALAIVLLYFQRSVFGRRDVGARYVMFAALAVTVFCLIIKLPGPNTFDKLGYLVFFPVATIGGWSLADFVSRFKTTGARARATAMVVVVCFLPVNGLAFAACFFSPSEDEVTPDEERVSAWVRDNTAREAVFIDDGDRVFLLVTGPRRYYWGRMAYAHQWGYDKREMSLRYHVRRTLYSQRPLDANTLRALGSVPGDLYVVVRADGTHIADNVTKHAEFFDIVYMDGAIGLAKVDQSSCLDAAESGDYPTITEEELLRESGL